MTGEVPHDATNEATVVAAALQVATTLTASDAVDGVDVVSAPAGPSGDAPASDGAAVDGAPAADVSVPAASAAGSASTDPAAAGTHPSGAEDPVEGLGAGAADDAKAGEDGAAAVSAPASEADAAAKAGSAAAKAAAKPAPASEAAAARDGWVTEGGKTYYYRQGRRLTGAQSIDGAWYYLDPAGDGALATGERELDGAWYYFDPARGGARAQGELVTLDGAANKLAGGVSKTVYYDGDGRMHYGELELGGAWRYFKPGSGAEARGECVYLDGAANGLAGGVSKVVYYDDDGSMHYGELYCGGSWYYMHPLSGARAEDECVYLDGVANKLANDQSKVVYYNSIGQMWYGELYCGGSWYYMHPGSGARAEEEFVDLPSKTVYYNSIGQMVYGSQTIDGIAYTFEPGSGALVKAGWQNPSWAFQVSAKSVTLPAWAYDTPYNYVSPSQIGIWASREDCIETFISRAYDYLGTGYWWDAALAPGVGVDCAGLVVQCLYACGMDLGDSYNPADHMYYNDHYANDMSVDGRFAWVDYGDRQRGDLIFYPGHVAIYLGNDTIIEAYPGSVQINGIGSHYGVGAITAVRRPFI